MPMLLVVLRHLCNEQEAKPKKGTCFPELYPPPLPLRRSFTSDRTALKAESTIASLVLPPETQMKGRMLSNHENSTYINIHIFFPVPLAAISAPLIEGGKNVWLLGVAPGQITGGFSLELEIQVLTNQYAPCNRGGERMLLDVLNCNSHPVQPEVRCAGN